MSQSNACHSPLEGGSRGVLSADDEQKAPRDTPTNFREHVTLGRSGLQVSRLCIGSGYGAPASACEKAFHEHNVNAFYWSLPRRAGMKKAIHTLAPNHRDDLVITVQSYSRSGMLLETFFERQLKSLKIDRADILLLGWFSHYPPQRVIDAALRLREQGKARYIALSGHRLATFAEIAQREDSPIDILMVRYNAARRNAETEVFERLPEVNRPGIVGYTTTCWGKLLDPQKMPPGEPPMTAAECYRFSLTNPHVDTCLIGPQNEAQMNEALETLDGRPMSNEELDRAHRIGDHVRT